eukprot:3941812-Rhodomonas_salina.12
MDARWQDRASAELCSPCPANTFGFRIQHPRSRDAPCLALTLRFVDCLIRCDRVWSFFLFRASWGTGHRKRRRPKASAWHAQTVLAQPLSSALRFGNAMLRCSDTGYTATRSDDAWAGGAGHPLCLPRDLRYPHCTLSGGRY